MRRSGTFGRLSPAGGVGQVGIQNFAYYELFRPVR